MSVPAELTDRANLAARTVPKMVLSDGTPSSKTPAPPPPDLDQDPVLAAQQRFAVTGNAVITGGAGTLGLAAAHALLEHGLHGLAILDANPSQSAVEIAALQARFPAAAISATQVDVTDEAAVRAAMDAAAAAMGSIDTLVCFVGIVGCVDALDMPVAQWRRVLDVNTTGTFICAQAAARHMVGQGAGGSIVLTASMSAHRVNYPQPQAAYNVSKAAIVALKSCLAAEWARYGIRVNSVSPGYMDTVLNAGNGIAEHRAVWASRNPTGRMGAPSELVGAVVLLASGGAGTYMNGSDIVVDGGAILF